MKIERPGIILFTEQYEQCVDFYKETVGLPFLYDKDGLTCFDFGGAYLMIESGYKVEAMRDITSAQTIIRFNVKDVKNTADVLISRGVHVEIHKFEWGIVGNFQDPDSNWCQLKDQTPNFVVTP